MTSISVASWVIDPVSTNSQIGMPNSVSPEPTIDTNWPTHIVQNVPLARTPSTAR